MKLKRLLSTIILLTFLCTSINAVGIQTAASTKIFDIKKVYNTPSLYKTQNEMLKALNQEYKDFTEIKVIGKTVEGRDIMAFKVGRGTKSVFINGSHHARENMTTMLILNQIENLCTSYVNGTKYNGKTYKETLDAMAIWFVPNVNPDGVELARSYNIKNAEIKDYPVFANSVSEKKSFKANARNVDLNRNYDTNWDNIFDREKYYPGSKPFSEPETQAIKKFCEDMKFDGTIAYHSSGQILFWHYDQGAKEEARDGQIAKDLKKITGYLLVPKWYTLTSKGLQPNGGKYSGGGYKDWFVQEFKKPGFTLEVGRASSPLSLDEYSEIWNDNKNVPIYFSDKAYKLFGSVKPTTEQKQLIRKVNSYYCFLVKMLL